MFKWKSKTSTETTITQKAHRILINNLAVMLGQTLESYLQRFFFVFPQK